MKVNEYGRYGGVPVRLPLRTMPLHIMGGLESFVREGVVHIGGIVPPKTRAYFAGYSRVNMANAANLLWVVHRSLTRPRSSRLRR